MAIPHTNPALNIPAATEHAGDHISWEGQTPETTPVIDPAADHPTEQPEDTPVGHDGHPYDLISGASIPGLSHFPENMPTEAEDDPFSHDHAIGWPF